MVWKNITKELTKEIVELEEGIFDTKRDCFYVFIKHDGEIIGRITNKDRIIFNRHAHNYRFVEGDDCFSIEYNSEIKFVKPKMPLNIVIDANVILKDLED